MGISDSDALRLVYRDAETATFEWRIPHSFGFRPRRHFSPPMNCLDGVFRLALFKCQSAFDYVALRREISPPWIPEQVRFTIRWKRTGVEERAIAEDRAFPQGSESWLVCIGPPIPEPALGDTLACTLWKRRDSPSSRALSSLSGHFKSLLLSGDGHDVLFDVKGRQFKAHKYILVARSPVFAEIFSNEVAGRAGGAVPVEDFDPDCFGDFLQFVYAGEVGIESVGRALGLYRAGHKYGFRGLKEMCVDFLQVSFTTYSVFDVVLLAGTHGEEELLHKAFAYFARHLEGVLLTPEWRHFAAEHPKRAIEMNIKAEQYLKTEQERNQICA